jgi:hypothetical protein
MSLLSINYSEKVLKQPSKIINSKAVDEFCNLEVILQYLSDKEYIFLSFYHHNLKRDISYRLVMAYFLVNI